MPSERRFGLATQGMAEVLGPIACSKQFVQTPNRFSPLGPVTLVARHWSCVWERCGLGQGATRLPAALLRGRCVPP